MRFLRYKTIVLFVYRRNTFLLCGLTLDNNIIDERVQPCFLTCTLCRSESSLSKFQIHSHINTNIIVGSLVFRKLYSS